MLLKNLRELGLSKTALIVVGTAWFQRSEVGGCEDRGRGVGYGVLDLELREVWEGQREKTCEVVARPPLSLYIAHNQWMDGTFEGGLGAKILEKCPNRL